MNKIHISRFCRCDGKENLYQEIAKKEVLCSKCEDCNKIMFCNSCIKNYNLKYKNNN